MSETAKKERLAKQKSNLVNRLEKFKVCVEEAEDRKALQKCKRKAANFFAKTLEKKRADTK